LIRFLLSILVLFFPIGIYCWVLGRINRRKHPVVISGIQDCAGMLLALSGFLLFICPSILTGFNYRPRDIWLYNHFGFLKNNGSGWWWVWWLWLWIMYLAVLIGGSVFLLRKRRSVTCIYNVDPEVVDGVLAQVLQNQGLEWAREQTQWFIGSKHVLAEFPARETYPAPHTPHLAIHATVPAGPVPDSSDNPFANFIGEARPHDRRYQDLLLDLEPWPAMRHVTLKWAPGTEIWRGLIEPELTRALSQVRTSKNPVGRWFLVVGACIFVLLFFVTVLYKLLTLLGFRVGV
jgi:hypothetical protein